MADAKKRPLKVLTDYRARQKPPMSITALARELGVSKATVSRWESGDREPAKDRLPVIAKLTRTSIAALLGAAA